MDVTLFDLFKGEVYNGSTRRLQNSNIFTSPFRLRLNENENSNFLGYRLKEIGNFTFTDKNISVDYNSDFQLYNTTLNSNLVNTTTMNFTFNSTQPNELRCWYAVNKILSSDATVSRRSITVCNSSESVICGPSEGIVLPHKATFTLPLSAIPEKEYGLWMTCRENAHASRTFKEPYLAMRLTNYYTQNLLSPRIFDVECKQGHDYFPYCCSSGKANKDNKLVCSSKYINAIMLLSIFLIAFLFN